MKRLPLSRRMRATLRGMVRAAVAQPGLGGDRPAIVEDVVDYVAAQIAAMPLFLRLPTRCGLWSFALLALLRHGRPFWSLSPERQAAWMTNWDAAPLRPARDLVKLVRSTALFVYFDHPELRPELEAAKAV